MRNGEEFFKSVTALGTYIIIVWHNNSPSELYSKRGDSMTFLEFLKETIVKQGKKFVVMNKKKTKVLGKHDTRKSAVKQLAAIEINKGRE